jgi:hypothetical protein
LSNCPIKSTQLNKIIIQLLQWMHLTSHFKMRFEPKISVCNTVESDISNTFVEIGLHRLT